MKNQLKVNTELAPVNLNGEIIQEPIYSKLSKELLQQLVETYPRNSFGVLFNDMFETDNFLFIFNGKWYFFDAYTKNENEVIQHWNWIENVQECENDCSSDELESFQNGWEYKSDGEFPESTLDFILEKLGQPDSPMIQVDVPTITDNIHSNFFKMEINKIVCNDKLSNKEKTEMLFNMMQKTQ